MANDMAYVFYIEKCIRTIDTGGTMSPMVFFPHLEALFFSQLLGYGFPLSLSRYLIATYL